MLLGAPGRALTDFRSGGQAGGLRLRPAMTLSTRLLAVNRMPRQRIGYRQCGQCPEDRPVGVAAISRDVSPPLAGRYPVLVNGVSAGVGRVSMDLITDYLRIQPTPSPACGPPVGWRSAVETIADAASTIGYEPLCSITRRCVRRD